MTPEELAAIRQAIERAEERQRAAAVALAVVDGALLEEGAAYLAHEARLLHAELERLRDEHATLREHADVIGRAVDMLLADDPE